MAKIRIKMNTLVAIALSYIYISCMLFSAFWLKRPIAVFVTLALVISLVGLIHTISRDERNTNVGIDINIIWFVLIIAFVFCIGMIGGWSGYGHQANDWMKHNAILNDLLERKWPVIYENNGEKALLTYYIGQYLLPAFIGKIVHGSLQSILFINWIWSSLGLAIVILLFMTAANANSFKKQIFCILIVILAGGMMSLQQVVGSVMYPDIVGIGKQGWEDYFFTYGDYMLQYRTNFVSICWTYGQTLVPWMISIILYKNWDKVSIYIPLVVPCVLFGSFPAVSLVILAIAFFVKYCADEKNIKNILINTFSWQNILSFVSLGMVLIIYYLGYLLQPKPDTMGFQLVSYPGRYIGLYLIFVLGSFGLYALVMAKEQKKNIAFWTVVIIMSVLPFFKGGSANDLLMGACIAPSMLLYLLITKWMFMDDNMLMFRKGAMLVLLMVGFLKPAMEIYYCVHNYDYTKYEPFDSLGGTLVNLVGRDNPDTPPDMKYNYYTYDADSSLFMKYIGEK